MIGKTISHYKIIEEIGRGGMGIVYKAQDLNLDRFVALKFLLLHLINSEEEKQRFIQEAKAAASLDHTNICAIHEIDETKEGQIFISMAYYEGETLDKKLKEKPLPIDEAIEIALQIAQGLTKAHEKRIIHRDIKPANIMLTSDSVVKILDFGLAKLPIHSKLTKEGATLGTIVYMSPEQTRGESVNQQTDIWSFGVILYEMITGQLPFKGDYDQAIIYSILNEEPKIHKRLPTDVGTLVYKCLRKNVNERYQNIDEILNVMGTLKKSCELVVQEDKILQMKSIPSIAVLPFADMSQQRDQEYFCDGIAEELISTLTHIKYIHVVARTSAFSFKNMNIDIREIGRKLNVEHVLEGSVRKSENRVRITAQLINVADGFHLWSERYDREMKDIFTIQDEISLAIVDNLKIKLLREEKSAIFKRHTANLEAYNFYLKGIYFLRMYTAEGFEKAIKHFDQSLKMDPDYALAYYGQAEVLYAITYWGNIPPNQAYPKARICTKKALEIDPSLAEAHAGLGLVYAFYDWNWNQAEKELKKALRLNTNSAIIHLSHSWYLSLVERHDEAIVKVKRAQELDPLSGLIGAHIGLACIWASQYDKAIEELQLVLAINPNFYLAHYYLGLAYRAKSMFEQAIIEFEKAVTLGPKAPWPEMILAATYFEYDRKVEGESIAQRLRERAAEEYIPPLGFFYIHHVQGKSDEAFEWLAKACIERDSFLPWCRIIPIDKYRFPDEPRVSELLKRNGLK